MAQDSDDTLAEDASKLDLNGHSPLGLPAVSSNDTDWFAVRKNHKLEDITEQFKNASNALHVGQIVREENFSLFDSVQALEIMEPKMDSGYLKPGETLYDDYDIGRELLAEEVLGIIEQMLCYEMAWHQGYPLAQTLFTSLYIDNLTSQKRQPNTLPFFVSSNGSMIPEDDLLQKVLRAYCIGVIKTCDIAIEMVTSQLYFEEEDFHAHTYNRDLLTDIPDEESLSLLADACAWLNAQEITPAFEGLFYHLKSRTLFMEALMPDRTGCDPPSHCWSMLRELVIEQRLSTVGVPVKEAFSAKLQRKLATMAPPRPTIELTLPEAHQALWGLYDDIEAAIRVREFEPGHSPRNLFTFLWTFAYRNPPPSTFARAVLMSLVLGEDMIAGSSRVHLLLSKEINESQLGVDVIDDSMMEVEMPTDYRYEVVKQVESFADVASLAYMNVLRALCQNQCRIRRCLINALSEFDGLEQFSGSDSAAQAGSEAKEAIVSLIRNCVLCLKLRIMEWIVQLGFEQELYQVHELSGLYWYLCDLSRQRTNQHESLSWHGYLASSGHPSPPLSQAAMANLGRRRIRWQHEEIVQLFAGGLSLVYSVLHKFGLVKAAPSAYSTPELRFEVRMRPFLKLAKPDPPSDEYFAVSLEPSAYDTLVRDMEEASSSLNRASSLLLSILKQTDANAVGKILSEDSWNKDMKNVIKACITARLTVAALLKVMRTYGTVELARPHVTVVQVMPPPGERAHAWWIVPVVEVD